MFHSVVQFRNRLNNKLQELRPDDFQALAIRFVRLRAGGEGIVWAAENSDGSPGQGHPDGRVVLGNGRYVDVEVSKVDAWATKIQSDVPSLEALGRGHFINTDELIFVTSHRVDLRIADRTAAREIELRNSVAPRLGLKLEQIKFVHQFQMAEELTHPRYAQLISSYLNESFRPVPFVSVGHELRVRYGGAGLDWRPTVMSFEDGSLRVPQKVHSQIMSLLSTNRELVVWGQRRDRKNHTCTLHRVSKPTVRRRRPLLRRGVE